jgi:hypothetical protein
MHSSAWSLACLDLHAFGPCGAAGCRLLLQPTAGQGAHSISSFRTAEGSFYNLRGSLCIYVDFEFQAQGVGHTTSTEGGACITLAGTNEAAIRPIRGLCGAQVFLK